MAGHVIPTSDPTTVSVARWLVGMAQRLQHTAELEARRVQRLERVAEEARKYIYGAGSATPLRDAVAALDGA